MNDAMFERIERKLDGFVVEISAITKTMELQAAEHEHLKAEILGEDGVKKRTKEIENTVAALSMRLYGFAMVVTFAGFLLALAAQAGWLKI